VATSRQVKGSPSLVRAAAIRLLVTQSTGIRVAVGPYSGFRVGFRFRLVGVWGVAAGGHEGNFASPSLDSLAGWTPSGRWWSGWGVSFDCHG
jgi:hypothetical protein